MLLLLFRAADSLYGVDVTRVVEVVPRLILRRLPHAPRHLVGMFDYRDCCVPVVDVSLLLGAEPCRDQLGTRIILVDCGARGTPDDATAPPVPGPDDHGTKPAKGRARSVQRRMLGMMAERVNDVETIEPGQVISPPLNLPAAPYLGALVDFGSEMIQLIEPDRILDADLSGAFFGVVAGAGPARPNADRSVPTEPVEPS